MRYLGLDLGSKTLGIAISDNSQTIASVLTTIRFEDENYDSLLPALKKIIDEENIQKIILGFPKNMNNTIGDRAEKSLEFAEMLKKRTGLPVVMWDERLTTVAANRTLMETGVRREHRKEYIDQIAAVFILQGYLDRKSKGK